MWHPYMYLHPALQQTYYMKGDEVWPAGMHERKLQAWQMLHPPMNTIAGAWRRKLPATWICGTTSPSLASLLAYDHDLPG